MGYGVKPLLISAAMDSTIRLWDVATQKQIETLQYKDSQVNSMCITPDGAQFLIGAWQNLRIYDINCLTPNGLHNSTVHEKNVTAVGFQADGAWMYTGGEDCMAKIWDMRINQLNCQRIFQVNTTIHSIALHPNQVELLIADSTGAIYLWDLRSDRDDSLITEVDMSEYIVHIDIERLGRQCAAVTNRGHLFFWDISHKGMATAAPIVPQMPAMPMPPHQQMYGQQPSDMLLMQRAGGHMLPGAAAMAAAHPTIGGYHQQQMMPQQMMGDFYSAYPPPDTTALLPPIAPPPPPEMAFQMPTAQNQIQQMPADDQRQQQQQRSNMMAGRRYSGHGEEAREQERVVLTAQEPQIAQQPFVPPAVDPTTSTAAAAALPPLQAQPLLTTNTKYNAKLRAHNTFALKCRYRPDGLAIATTSADQTTKLWSIAEQNLLNTYTTAGNKWVWDCAFTNDSAYMITASFDGILRMWDLATGSVVRLYQGHSMGIQCMAFKDFN